MPGWLIAIVAVMTVFVVGQLAAFIAARIEAGRKEGK